MNAKLIRTIHPIGQGGFASEYFPESNQTFVYDCGSSSNLGTKHEIELMIKASLPSSTINGLFISHFDEDHINLIPYLLRNYKIEKVFIPFINDESKNLINIFFRSAELARLATSPRDYFGEDTQIIEIDELEERNINNLNDEVTGMDALGRSIQSGEPVVFKESSWEYLFFNVKTESRRLEFLNLCKIHNPTIDIARLNEPDYVNCVKDELKEIYQNITGGINQNSLLVYSGQTSDSFMVFDCPYNIHPFYFQFIQLNHFKNAVGGFYTGDYDCTHLIQVQSKLGLDRQKKVGMLQIPHHGAKNNWRDDLIFENTHILFAQSGISNGYGHPSVAVMQLIKNKCPSARIQIIQNDVASILILAIVEQI